MTYSVPGAAILQDDMLTRGVLLRRIIAWLIDLALLGAVAGMLVSSILAMGFLTLGLAWTALPLVPMLPLPETTCPPWGAAHRPPLPLARPASSAALRRGVALLLPRPRVSSDATTQVWCSALQTRR